MWSGYIHILSGQQVGHEVMAHNERSSTHIVQQLDQMRPILLELPDTEVIP